MHLPLPLSPIPQSSPPQHLCTWDPQFGSDLGQEQLVSLAGGFSPRAASSAATSVSPPCEAALVVPLGYQEMQHCCFQAHSTVEDWEMLIDPGLVHLPGEAPSELLSEHLPCPCDSDHPWHSTDLLSRPWK